MPISSRNNPYAKTDFVNTSGADFDTLKSELNKSAHSSGVGGNAELRFSSGKGIYAKNDTWNKTGKKFFGSNKIERANKYLDARDAVARAINVTRSSQAHQGKWVGDYVVDKVVKDRVRKEVLREFGVREWELGGLLGLDRYNLVKQLQNRGVNVRNFFDKERPLRENACLRLSDLATIEQELEALEKPDYAREDGLLEIGKRDFKVGDRLGDGKRPDLLISHETDFLIRTAANDIIAYHVSIGDQSEHAVPDDLDKAEKEDALRKRQNWAYGEAKRLLRKSGVNVKTKRVGRNKAPFTPDGLSEANVKRSKKVLKDYGYEPRFTNALSRSLTLPNAIHYGANHMLKYNEKAANSANQVLRAGEQFTQEIDEVLAPDNLNETVTRISDLMEGNKELLREIKSLPYPDSLGNYALRTRLCERLSDNLEAIDAQMAVLENLRPVENLSFEVLGYIDATMNAAERLCAEGIYLGYSLAPAVSITKDQPKQFDPSLTFLLGGRDKPRIGEFVFSDREKLIDVALGRELSVPEEIFKSDSLKGETIAEVTRRYNESKNSLRPSYRDYLKIVDNLASVDRADRSDHLEMLADLAVLQNFDEKATDGRRDGPGHLSDFAKKPVFTLADMNSRQHVRNFIKKQTANQHEINKQEAKKDDISEQDTIQDDVADFSLTRKTKEDLKRSYADRFEKAYEAESDEDIQKLVTVELRRCRGDHISRLQDLYRKNEQITDFVARQKKVLGIFKQDNMRHPLEVIDVQNKNKADDTQNKDEDTIRDIQANVTVDDIQSELKALADQRHALLLLGYALHLRPLPKLQDAPQYIEDNVGLFSAENLSDEDDDEPHISGIAQNDDGAGLFEEQIIANYDGNEHGVVVNADHEKFEMKNSHDMLEFKGMARQKGRDLGESVTGVVSGRFVDEKIRRKFDHASGLLKRGGRKTESAIRMLKEVADTGHVDAMYKLAVHYHGKANQEAAFVKNPRRNRRVFDAYKKAANWYGKASSAGKTAAKLTLARLTYDGMGVEKNIKEALKLAKGAAVDGDNDAQRFVGEYYKDSLRRGHRDDQEALKWLNMAAREHHPRALFLLGEMYSEGQGVTQDEDQARKLFRRAAFLHDVNAQTTLGLAYLNGQTLEASDIDAVPWLARAAIKGHRKAQRRLGDMLIEGRGVEKNVSLAFRLYRLAAAQGDLDARYKIGEAFLTGKYSEIKQDDAQAKRWLSAFKHAKKHQAGMAAYEQVKDFKVPRVTFTSEDDHSSFMGEVKTALQQLVAGSPKPRERVENDNRGLPEAPLGTRHFNAYAKRAKNGDKEAQYWISKACFEGVGVDKDSKSAQAWLRAYANQDVTLAPSAKENLFDTALAQIPEVLNTGAAIDDIAAFKSNIDETLGQEESLLKAKQFFDDLDTGITANIRNTLGRLSELKERSNPEDIEEVKAAKDELRVLKIEQTESLNKAYALYRDIQSRNGFKIGLDADLESAPFDVYEVALEDYLKTARVTRMILRGAEEEAARLIEQQTPPPRGTDLAE